MEHEWLLMLGRQWDIECELLPNQLAKQLQRPQMAFHDFSNTWACWERKNRRMVFSRQLQQYPWPAFRAVLRHEMGHQLADTCLGGMQQTAHGPAFRAACELLQAEITACCDHPGYSERQKDTPESRIRRRVRKLLALAESSNRNEAEAAMLKAHQQIRHYHLELFESAEQPAYVSCCLGKAVSRRPRYFYTLANLLQDHYYVYAIWIYSTMSDRLKPGTILEISGTRDDVELAAYVYDFVLLHLERLWKNYRKTHQISGHRKTDFAIGLIQGFTEKISLNEKPVTSYEHALLSLAQTRLATYQKQRYPRTCTRQHGSHSDPHVQKDGLAHGRDLVLQRGMHKHNGNRNRQRSLSPVT